MTPKQISQAHYAREDRGAPDRVRQWAERRRVRWFLSNTRGLSATVVEIGVGAGEGLAAWRTVLPSSRHVAVDIDEAVAKGLRASTTHIVLADAQGLPLRSGSIDIVVAMQVIEHVPDPEVMLAEIRRILAPHGTLILTTPNTDSIAARRLGAKWRGFRPDHVSLRGTKGWRSSLGVQGFVRVVDGLTLLSGLVLDSPLLHLDQALLTLRPCAPWSRGESYVGVWTRGP